MSVKFPVACGCAALCAAWAFAQEGAGARPVRDGAREFDGTATEGAARIVLGELADETLADAEVPRAALEKRMLADPGEYRSAAASRVALEDFYAREMAGRYAAKARGVLERLAGARGVTNAFSGAFLAEGTALSEASLADSVKANYATAFAAARAAACRTQTHELVANVRALEEEVDSLAKAEVIRRLTARLAERQRTPVFEENLRYVSEKLAEPIYRAAEKQKREQVEALRRCRAEAWTVADAEAELAEALVAALAKRRAAAHVDEWVYGVFPSVTNRTIHASAERCVMAHVAKAVASARVEPDEAAILLAVDSDESPEDAARANVAKLFEPDFRSRTLAAALADAVAAAPADKRDEFRRFAHAHAGAPAVTGALKARVAAALLPVVDRARMARTAELKLADEKGEACLAELRASIATGRPLPSVGEIETNILNRTVRAWDGMRAKLLADDAAAHYEALLPSVHKRIREKAKMIFDGMKQSLPAPGGEGFMAAIPCEASFDLRGDEIVVDFAVDGASLGVVKVDARRDRYGESVRRATDAVRALLDARLKERAIAAGSVLELHVAVRNGFVYYGATETMLETVRATARAHGLEVAFPVEADR